MAAAIPAAQAQKKTVPSWLRAEMLKRGINLNASGGTVLFAHCKFDRLSREWLTATVQGRDITFA